LKEQFKDRRQAMIDFKCPTCGKTLQVTEMNAGKKARCPGCNSVLTVPEASSSNNVYDPASPTNPFAGATPARAPSAATAAGYGPPQGASGAGDFLSFKKMITPAIIMACFWIGLAIIMVAGLVMLAGGAMDANLIRIMGGLLVLLAGPIIWRVYCEVLILFFRMNETLTDIHNTLRANGTKR
jgi:DNA-directed RNA polymerase subunit RPC12/RpoP